MSLKNIVTLIIAILLAVMMIGCETDEKDEKQEDGGKQSDAVIEQENKEDAGVSPSAANTDASSAGASGAPVLSEIGIGEWTLSPAFREDITDYTVTVASGTQSVVLSPAPAQPGWEYSIVTGAQTSAGTDAVTVPLNEGDTKVQIIVSAPGTGEKTVYTVMFVREAAAPESDLALIASLLGKTREEAIGILGGSFSIVDEGGDAWLEGFYYAHIGITLSFYKEGTAPDPSYGITEDDLNRVLYVTCDGMVDINGAKVGMTLDQIKAFLGEPVKIQPADESYPVDTVYFEADGMSICFRMGGENKESDLASISKIK